MSAHAFYFPARGVASHVRISTVGVLKVRVSPTAKSRLPSGANARNRAYLRPRSLSVSS
ncbi:hypothetical protein FTUN_5990 [Frigoriglobus tundricola]|uniref:Uncharacterized protein n=1 Tax=Frigoriglobus tundricola TaxID=2774151 RepID=A0A6M5YY42_9BACT|nr:hypothetical protein FTUN_5990 [Frigoriglobus tundricola]